MAYTQAGNRAAIKYKKEKVKRIPLDVSIEQYEQIKEYATTIGKPVNTFIKELIFDAINS